MRKIITLSILLVLAIVHTTTAQTVDLNRDFNVCGSVTNSFAGNGTSFIRHSSVKSNGKVLAAGYSQTFKALFAQYHSNGNADPAFGYTPGVNWLHGIVTLSDFPHIRDFFVTGSQIT